MSIVYGGSTAARRVRGRRRSMDPLHSQHYLRIKAALLFFLTSNLTPYLLNLTRVLSVSFSPRSLGQPV